MWPMRRAKDEDDERTPPADDAYDWHLSDAQRRVRATADTRKAMRAVWETMQANLRCPWGNGKPMRYLTRAD